MPRRAQKFIKYSPCTTESQLHKHLSDLKEMLNKYGGDLKKDPQPLSLMFIGMLLLDLKQTITGKPSAK